MALLEGRTLVAACSMLPLRWPECGVGRNVATASSQLIPPGLGEIAPISTDHQGQKGIRIRNFPIEMMYLAEQTISLLGTSPVTTTTLALMKNISSPPLDQAPVDEMEAVSFPYPPSSKITAMHSCTA